MDKTVVLSTKANIYITNSTKCQGILSKMWHNISQCHLQSSEYARLVSFNQLNPCCDFRDTQLNRPSQCRDTQHRLKEAAEVSQFVARCQPNGGVANELIVAFVTSKGCFDPLPIVLQPISGELAAFVSADEIDKPTAGILWANDVRAFDICKDCLRSFRVFGSSKPQGDVSLQIV